MKKVLAMTAMTLTAMTAQADMSGNLNAEVKDGAIEVTESPVKGDKGFFVQGVLIAGSTYELDGEALDKASGFGIRLGYQFNKHLAIEVSELFQGEGNDSEYDGFYTYDAAFEAQTTQVGVKLTLPLRPDNAIALLARVGLAASIADFSGSQSNGLETISFNEEMFGFGNYIGVGIQARPHDNLFLTLDYTIQKVSYEFEDSLFDDAVGDLDVDNKALNLGIGYQW